ncbi:hypothetical protein [Pseudomarimonas arenosa]|uniref:DUF4136 domain-containing protein n=1 Tax=Pseudomarimonas arenosa TaxID=2774145 RepID=A0AAW3ZQ19_9GAMM|nr:hypothetical protein [Pseudomarimonas arenosa]MBD8528211.1 hypothetical protein [Pseudomarimonas arenosa]
MHRARWKSLFLVAIAASSTGCANRYQNVLLGTAVAGQAPINEIEQIYYLGVLDPRGQVPPQMYRIRVHGQSSLGGAHFASGWVPSSVVDSLNPASINPEHSIIGAGEAGSTFLGGRNLIAFGPEGFREVPQDHRLVMVMGSDSSKFFTAVGEALGAVSAAKIHTHSVRLNDELFRALSDLLREQKRLADFSADQGGVP